MIERFPYIISTADKKMRYRPISRPII